METEYDSKKLVLYIKGSDELDYLIFHFKRENSKYLLYRLEFSSEDPG